MAGESRSHLDQHQIFQRAFDEETDRLRVDVTASVEPGSMEMAVSHLDDSIKIGDGTDYLAINADGSINANITGTMAVAVSHTDDSIKIGDGTDILSVNADGSINVVLPTDHYRKRITEAPNCSGAYSWTDFGTSTERLSTITYTSATYPGVSVIKTFNYTNVSGTYRLDSVVWSVV
jgi:hypothetical protein